MKKIIISAFLTLMLIGVLSGNVAAEPSNASSFELFWPIVAGKTAGDSTYKVKILKENLRGLVIFGQVQKADYAVFLAVKRVVEAEKLTNEGKNDLADKTLKAAEAQMVKANASIDKALASGTASQNKTTEIKNRLTNLEVFLPSLALKSDFVLDQVKTLNQKI